MSPLNCGVMAEKTVIRQRECHATPVSGMWREAIGRVGPCGQGLRSPGKSGGGRCVFVQTVEGARQKHRLGLRAGELAGRGLGQ